MFTTFKDYINEDKDTVYFTFGRMNPPTIGHEKLLDKLSEQSGNSDYKVYLSHSHGAKTKSGENKDPLVYESKIKYVRKAFPKHARSVITSETVKNPFGALVELYNQGYTKVVMVAGSDRVSEFTERLNLYNGKEGRHGFYNFEEGIKVISAGVRDADSEDITESASGTKMREFASQGDFRSFSQNLPEALNNTEAKKLFNEVRMALGLEEQTEFKRHIQLEPVSEEREEFVKGNLFQIGDEVVIKETSEVGTIAILGANYVIVESNGNRYRKWLHDIELVEEGQPEWGTPESTKKAVAMTPGQVNPTKALEVYRNKKRKEIKGMAGDVAEQAKYHKGLSKSTIAKRKAHFKKGTEMDDNNPAAYKPAPGDAQAKTKPSKYTLKYKRMYGENLDEDAGKSLADKAEKSGISKSILKQVYNRGVAAWRTGHRPGTTPSQWGHARVNSFITGGKTRTTADADLWKKHKGK